MMPSSKSKESVTARAVPPPAGVRSTGKSAPLSASRVPAQKFVVWPEDWREHIAVKAYELWEQRGRRQGHDVEDWLDAETFVVESRHEAPKQTGGGA